MTHVLVLALRALGDSVLMTPIIRLLKQRGGAGSLTLLVDALGAEVFQHNPWVDRLIVLDRAAQRRLPWHERLRADWTLIGALRAERFDTAVDLFSGPRSAWLARLSGAPRRYGPLARARGRGWLYTDRVPIQEAGRHLVEQKLQLIRPLIGEEQSDLSLELVLTGDEREWAEGALRERGHVAGRPLIGFFPGAGWDHKCWPAERFAELGDRLGRDAAVAILGGIRDREACHAVATRMTRRPLMFDELGSLRQTMALIARTDLFIANDTGPMHVAVALGRPTIALFGPSDVSKYGPWGPHATVVQHVLPCNPCPQQEDTCHRHGRARQECMTLITVDEVAAHAQRLLASRIEVGHGG
ncbi:MAG: glycosyltransferase family 9 protein [Nitrospirae bacterium]|nr:glycosyltransferase family 9 protein [Nitrospirota bacterium]